MRGEGQSLDHGDSQLVQQVWTPHCRSLDVGVDGEGDGQPRVLRMLDVGCG